MTLNALQALTWGTVGGAIVGALLLASIESQFSDSNRSRRADTGPRLAPVDASTARMSNERPQPVMLEKTQRREVAVR